MKKKTIVFALPLLFFLSSQSYARSCSSYEYDKAEYYAEKAGKKIIAEYGGGRDERINLTNCEYNSFSEIYNLKIEVYWNGSIIRDNHYNVDGELKLKANGTNVNFSQTYASDSVKDLSFFRGLAAGALVLGSLASESGTSSSGSASNGYGLKFTNYCNKTLDLAIQYQTTAGDWVSKGWWSFKPNRTAYLSNSNNQRLKTNAATLYYFVEPSDGTYMSFDGSYAKSFEGRTLYMKKIIDDSGDTNWSETCN